MGVIHEVEHLSRKHGGALLDVIIAESMLDALAERVGGLGEVEAAGAERNRIELPAIALRQLGYQFLRIVLERIDADGG